EYRSTFYNLSLNDIANLILLETLGLERVLWSMILQCQEEPQMTLNIREDNGYPTKIGSWSHYIVRYRIDLTYVYFKIQLQTSNDNDDGRIKGAKFIIGILSNRNITLEINTL
ncbi:7433_t:CDS:2, partial [Gigaspora margarita]